MSYFELSEFECKCGRQYCDGGSQHIEPILVEGLEELRELVGLPLIVNSGYRCPQWNKLVGGTRNSQHTQGKAADIRITTAMRQAGITAEQLAALAETIECFDQGGIGVYNTFVHLDVRGVPARWDRRS